MTKTIDNFSAQIPVDMLLTAAETYGYSVPAIAKITGFDKESLRRWREGSNQPAYDKFLFLEYTIKRLTKPKKKKK